MQDQSVIEASNHANNTSEDAQARDTNTRVDTPLRNSLQDALEYEVRKTELLEKVLVEKTELTNTLLSYTHELEQRLVKERRQRRSLRENCEQARAYYTYLYQKLSERQEKISSLQDQVTECGNETNALRTQLHERAAAIEDLEEQNRHLKAKLDEVASRMHNVRQKASSCTQELSAKHVHSQHSDIREEYPVSSHRESRKVQEPLATVAPAPIKPVRGTFKTPSTNDSAVIELIFAVTFWIRCLFNLAEPREVYFHSHECHPKVSSPEFKARVKRMIYYEQLALARRQYLVSIDLPGPIERSDYETQSSRFATLRRQHEEEERRWFARKIEPMTSMEER
jgi:DNA-binding ferritin-like protein